MLGMEIKSLKNQAAIELLKAWRVEDVHEPYEIWSIVETSLKKTVCLIDRCFDA